MTLAQPVIDAHIHVHPFEMLRPSARETFWHGKPDAEAFEALGRDPRRLLHVMDEQRIERVGLINYVSPDLMGFTDEINEWSARYASAAPDRLIAFGPVNPRFTTDVGAAADAALAAGVRALKVHPPHQGFAANAYLDRWPRLAELYERAQAAGVPVTIHTGTSIFPGARSKYGDPMPIDDVATDFPNLTILLAHGGRPIWMAEAFFLVRRHANVHLELSGIPPKKLLEYFPRLGEVADKTVWGTDWPSPGVRSMAGNVEDFLALDLPDGAKRKILYDNAARIWT